MISYPLLCQDSCPLYPSRCPPTDSAGKINKELGRTGTLWMPDYFDRYIRDQAHLDACIHYIRHNPVKAGLVDAAENWLYSG